MNLQCFRRLYRPNLFPFSTVVPIDLYTTSIQTRASYCTEKEEHRSWRVRTSREGEWYSAFSLFAPKTGTSPDVIRFLQAPIDLRPSKIRSWWRRKKQEKEIFDQRYITERHDILGNDLAAAHFIVHRGGSVKFLDQSKWIKKVEDEDYDLELPSRYRPDFLLECIDASYMDLQHEGLQNLVRLKKLHWLSLKGCKYIDDWCIDRISGEYHSTLEYLDLSDCPKVTERSLSAMYRLNKLKTLKLNNLVTTRTFELSCLLLEEINPNLSIEGVTYVNPSETEKEKDVKE